MITQDNDTLYAEKNSNEKQNPSQPKADKSETKNAMIAKLIAASGAGLAAGAGAAYAAGHFAGSEAVAEPAADEAQTQGAAEQQETEPTIEERVSTLEEKERIREQQEQERQQQEQEQKPEENDKPEGNDFFKEHEVKIETIEQRTLDDGTTVNVYSGTVDGHQAVFMDDGNGRVDFAIVDENDNGTPDTSEIIDLADNNISTQELTQFQVPAPAPEPTPEINVVAVEHNVDIEGHTVDVAAVTIGDQPVMLIDANQNGEVDLAVADMNQNNQIDEGEIQDVRSAHIAMPTEDDVTGSMVANVDDGTEDYSNNADVQVYEI